MLGAIIGDIVGSRFEWNNIKSKEFRFFTAECRMTDDSIMTLAVAQAIVKSQGAYEALGNNSIEWMQRLGRKYPNAGYGERFRRWLTEEQPTAYHSYGNGAAMRVSPCGFAAKSEEEAKRLAKAVTEVTHDHPESLKAAEAVSVGIYMALHGSGMEEIRAHITENYYPISFTLEEIRPDYRFDVSCQGSVPQAFEAFFESTGYEDAIRNAVSIGGDSDTIAAVTGGLAEAYYGIPEALRDAALRKIQDRELTDIIEAFRTRFSRPA